MTYDLLDELVQELCSNSTGIRIPLYHPYEARAIFDGLCERCNVDLDYEVYQNNSGQMLMWVNMIF